MNIITLALAGILFILGIYIGRVSHPASSTVSSQEKKEVIVSPTPILPTASPSSEINQ